MTSLSRKSEAAFASESLAKTDRSLLLLPRRPGPRLTPNIPGDSCAAGSVARAEQIGRKTVWKGGERRWAAARPVVGGDCPRAWPVWASGGV